MYFSSTTENEIECSQMRSQMMNNTETQNPEEDVVLSETDTIDKVEETPSGRSGVAKRKKQATRSTTKKTKQEQHWDLMMNQKVTEIPQFLAKAIKKDIVNDLDQVTGLLEIIGDIKETHQEENCVHPATFLLLIGIFCPNHVETLMNPKKWLHQSIQTTWNEAQVSLQVEEVTQMLIVLRKNLRTSYTDMRVQSVVNLCREYTVTSLQLLSHLDIMELINVYKSLNDSLNDTHLHTGISSQLTGIISTSPTSVPVQTALVDVVGCNGIEAGPSLANVDFVELLERPNYKSPTLSIFCDTYLKALDASKELVDSVKMKDYLIDINIYRQVILLNYLLKQRLLYLNERMLRKSTYTHFPIQFNKRSLLSLRLSHNEKMKRLLDIHNSYFQNNIARVFNCEPYLAFLVCRTLITFSENTLKEVWFNQNEIFNYFNEYKYYSKRCTICNFVHGFVKEPKMFENLKKTYVLLNDENILNIMKCKSILTPYIY